MKALNNGEVILDKALFHDIEFFYSDIFSEVKNYDKNNVIVNDKEIAELINKLKKEASITNVDFIKKINQIDKTDFNNAYEEYINAKYQIARKKFDNESTDNNLYDSLITNGLKMVYEINKIKSFPLMKKRITNMIDEIKESDFFNDINKIEDKFNKLCLSSSKFEEFEKLDRNLSKIISDTYKDELTDISSANSSDNIALIASVDEKTCFLLTNNNLVDNTYGVILSSDNNIKYATNNKNNKDLVPFSKLNKESSYIEVYDFEPIACFAITLGEKTINENYEKAEKLSQKYHSVPVVEIDITKYLSKEKCENIFNNFIDKLLDDKNVNFSQKDKDFYRRFENFYNEYKILKSGKYNEGNIINIFDNYFTLLSSSKVCDLDYLLNNYKCSEIETVLKYNSFMDDNIFRYNEVTKPMLERFIDKYYLYRLDKNLNKIYPGFNVVLNYLNGLNDDGLKQIVKVINDNKTVDSWFLAQTFDPDHASIYLKYNVGEDNFKAYLQNKIQNVEDEKSTLLSFKEYLSSLDEDKKEENMERAA